MTRFKFFFLVFLPVAFYAKGNLFSKAKSLLSPFCSPSLEDDFILLSGEGKFGPNPCLMLDDLLQRHPDWRTLFPTQCQRLQKFLEAKKHLWKGHEKRLSAFFRKYPPSTFSGWTLYAQVDPKKWHSSSSLASFWIQADLSIETQSKFIKSFKTYLAPFHLARIVYLLIEKKKNIALALAKEIHAQPFVQAIASPDASRSSFIACLVALQQSFREKKDTSTLSALWKKTSQLHKSLVKKIPAKIFQQTQEYLEKLKVGVLRHGFQEALTAYKNGDKARGQTVLKEILKLPMNTSATQWHHGLWMKGLIFAFGFEDWKKAKMYFALICMPEVRTKKIIKEIFGTTIPKNFSACSVRMMARAWFFVGLCQEKMGQNATKAFQKAARQPFFFYGQMAHFKLNIPLKVSFDQGQAAQGLKKNPIFRHLVAFWKKNYKFKTRFSSAFIKDLTQKISTVHDAVCALDLIKEVDGSNVVLTARRLADLGAHLTLPQAYATCSLPSAFDDPALVYSLILNETGFQGAIESRAGAWGPMQVMPHETPELAQIADIPHEATRRDWTYGMILGIKELEKKRHLFHGCLPLTVAAYNAGRNRVLTWVDSFLIKNSLEATWMWIEAIPYDETRYYIFNVMSHWFIYQILSKKKITPELIKKTIQIPLREYRVQ